MIFELKTLRVSEWGIATDSPLTFAWVERRKSAHVSLPRKSQMVLVGEYSDRCGAAPYSWKFASYE